MGLCILAIHAVFFKCFSGSEASEASGHLDCLFFGFNIVLATLFGIIYFCLFYYIFSSLYMWWIVCNSGNFIFNPTSSRVSNLLKSGNNVSINFTIERINTYASEHFMCFSNSCCYTKGFSHKYKQCDSSCRQMIWSHPC